MENIANTTESRETAGILLSKRLTEFKLSNSVVVGVPHGGACVAAAIARQLNLPLEVMMCRKIKDPRDPSKTIGSVSASDVIMHDCDHSIPQDYLYFESIRLRNEIRYEQDFYYGSDQQPPLEFKTVILVDDILRTPDTLLACIQEIRKMRALKVVVAVPFVEAEAARVIQTESDQLIFLKLQQHIQSPHEYYRDFPEVKEWAVRDLLRRGTIKINSGHINL